MNLEVKYVLKLIWETHPPKVIYNTVYRLCVSMHTLFFTVVFLRIFFSFIDNGAKQHVVLGYIVAMLLLKAASVSFQKWYSNYKSPLMDLTISQEFERAIINKLNSVDIACFETPEFYNNYVRASSGGYERFESTLNMICMFATNAVASIIGVIYIATIDPLLTLVVVSPLIMSFFIRKSNALSYDANMTMIKDRRRLSYTNGIFSNPNYTKETRTGNIIAPLQDYYKSSIDNISLQYKSYGFKQALLRICIAVFDSVIPELLAILYFVWRFAVRGDINVADFAVFITAITDINWRVSVVFKNHRAMQEDAQYIRNFKRFMEYESEIDETSVGIVPAFETITFKDVTFEYPNTNSAVLKNLCFDIRAGEKIVILGENGSGKSTLIKLLLRFYDPTNGSILYNAGNLKLYAAKTYRNKFSASFQDGGIFDATFQDNIRPEPLSDEEVASIGEKLNMTSIINRLITKGQKAEDLKHLGRKFDENGVILSGGEEKKALLFRALAKKGEIYIFDEPTANLDPIAEHDIFREIYSNLSEKTVVIVTHNVLAARAADRIVYMRDGRIVEQGSHDELLVNNGDYAKLVALQSGIRGGIV